MSVCLSVTKLAATYLVCKSKLRCYTILYGVPNACIVWISLKTLCLPVLTSFADGKLLDFSLSGTQRSINLYERLCTGAVYGMLSAWARFSESPAH